MLQKAEGDPARVVSLGTGNQWVKCKSAVRSGQVASTQVKFKTQQPQDLVPENKFVLGRAKLGEEHCSQE